MTFKEKLTVQHILYLLTQAKTNPNDNMACAIAHLRGLLVIPDKAPSNA